MTNPAKRRRGPTIDWSRVDWSLPTSDIARQLGVRCPTVSKARRRLAPQTVHQTPDWATVDWSMPTATIAAVMRTSRSAAVEARRTYAPQTLLEALPRGARPTKVLVSAQAASVARAAAKAAGMSISRWVSERIIG